MEDPIHADLALSLFYQSLQACLHNQLHCLIQVTAGQAECKDACADNLQRLTKGLDLAGEVFPVNALSELVASLSAQLAETRLAKGNLASASTGCTFVESIELHPLPEEREVLLEQISRELTYRFGPMLHYIVKQDNGSKLISKFAKVAALRCWFYAIAEDVGLYECESLANGAFFGFESIQDKYPSFMSRLSEVILLERDMQDAVPYRAEAAITCCAFATPQHRFWSHTDIARQERSKRQDNPFTYFVNAGQESRADFMVPKFGYVQLPSDELPLSFKYLPHIIYPTPAMMKEVTSVNGHIDCCRQFPVRYVSFVQIEAYLKDMKHLKNEPSIVHRRRSSKGHNSALAGAHNNYNSNEVITFNSWLRATYPDQFGCAKLTAAYRSSQQRVLDESYFRSIGLSFEDGNFQAVDFSYSTFTDVTFTNISASRLIGCRFIRCTARDHALNCCELAFSVMEDCDFRGLGGELFMNYATLHRCDFSKSKFINFTMKGPRYDAESGASLADCTAEDSDETYLEVKEIIAQERQSYIEQVLRIREVYRELNATAAEVLRETDAEFEHEIIDRMTMMNRKLESIRGHNTAFNKEHENVQRKYSKLTAYDANKRKDITEKFWESEQEIIVNDPVLKSTLITYPAQFIENNPNDIAWSDTLSSFEINHNGRHGHDGRDGMEGVPGEPVPAKIQLRNSYSDKQGQEHGLDGQPGENGESGADADPIRISLCTVPETRALMISPHEYRPMETSESDSPKFIRLYDDSARIVLNARGGDGGHGGRGGDGGKGADGCNGLDATPEKPGMDGGNGGNGGRGGDGGHGGSAGSGAEIVVLVKENDADLLYLVDGVDVAAGRTGNGGRGGTGATGGAAGKGGHPLTFEQNNEKEKTRVKCTNPGGKDGKAGLPGSDGKDGAVGMKGKAAKYTIRVLHRDRIKDYDAPFHIRLDSMDALVSSTGIIEPDQRIHLTGFMISNDSKMHAPGSSRIVIGLCDNSHIMPLSDGIAVAQALPREALRQLHTALIFKVRPLSMPLPNTVQSIHSNIQLQALLPRIQRFVPDFHSDPIPLVIEYPVELSVMQAGRTVLSSGKTPIAIKIRNNSNRAIGKYAHNPRLLRLTLDIQRDLPEDMMRNVAPVYSSMTINSTIDTGCTTAAGDSLDAVLANSGLSFDTAHTGLEGVDFTFMNSIVHDIHYLGPGEQIIIGGVLTIKNAAPALYQFLHLRCTCSLGHVDRPMHAPSIVNTQQEVAAVQVAEERKRLNKNDLLLVINSNTGLELVQHWREIAALLGMEVDVWNVSVYNGFAYDDPACSAIEQIPDGLVVFLNVPFFRDDNADFVDMAFSPVEYLRTTAIFDAARGHGIRTYVINAPTSSSLTGNNNGDNTAELNNCIEHVPIFPKRSVPLYHLPVSYDNTFPNRKSMIKAQHDDEKYEVNEHLPDECSSVTIKKAYLFGKPTRKAFQRKIDGLLSRLRAARPEQDYFAGGEYKPQKVGCKYGILKLYECGEVQMRRGLDTTYATMAARDCYLNIETNNTGNTNITATNSKITKKQLEEQGLICKIDLFVTVKLLSFKKKLQLFNNMSPKSTAHDRITEGILSDLADELFTFVKQYDRSASPKREKLLDCVALLKMFGQYDFSKVCVSKEGADKLQNLIIQVSAMTKHFRLWRRNLKVVVRDVTWNMFQEYFEAVGQIEYTMRRRKEAKKYKNFDAITVAYRNPYDMQFKHNVMLNNWFAYPTHEVSAGSEQDGDIDASALGPQGEKELLLFATGASEAALDKAISQAAKQDNLRRSLLAEEKAAKPSVLGSDKVSLVRHITQMIKYRRPKGPDLYPTSKENVADEQQTEGDFGPYNGPPVHIFGRLADLEPEEFGESLEVDYSNPDPQERPYDSEPLDHSRSTPVPSDYSYGQHDYSRWTATGDPYPADHSTEVADRSGSNADQFTPRSVIQGGQNTPPKQGAPRRGSGEKRDVQGIAELSGPVTHTSIADAVKAAAGGSKAAAPDVYAPTSTKEEKGAAELPHDAAVDAKGDEDEEFQKLLQSVQDIDDL